MITMKLRIELRQNNILATFNDVLTGAPYRAGSVCIVLADECGDIGDIDPQHLRQGLTQWRAGELLSMRARDHQGDTAAEMAMAASELSAGNVEDWPELIDFETYLALSDAGIEL